MSDLYEFAGDRSILGMTFCAPLSKGRVPQFHGALCQDLKLTLNQNLVRFIDIDQNENDESWFAKMFSKDGVEKELYLDDPVILQMQSTTIEFADQIAKVPLNKVFRATNIFTSDYDAIRYGMTKF